MGLHPSSRPPWRCDLWLNETAVGVKSRRPCGRDDNSCRSLAQGSLNYCRFWGRRCSSRKPQGKVRRPGTDSASCLLLLAGGVAVALRGVFTSNLQQQQYEQYELSSIPPPPPPSPFLYQACTRETVKFGSRDDRLCCWIVLLDLSIASQPCGCSFLCLLSSLRRDTCCPCRQPRRAPCRGLLIP